MHNDFVIIGPADDPAKIAGLDSMEAYKRISEEKALFVSRGDDSGTNKKELALWEEAGIAPYGSWYIQTGQGMGATIRIADEKQAYTMADRGTFLSHQEHLSLVVLVDGGESLYNPYGIILINPKKHKDLKINYPGALDFLEFITGPRGQAIIKDFGIKEYGRPLFYPDIIKRGI
jgi:tungstate transport system substrate-binding protein